MNIEACTTTITWSGLLYLAGFGLCGYMIRFWQDMSRTPHDSSKEDQQ